MADTGSRPPHHGFLRVGSIFVFIMITANLFEVGFTALTAYLPGTGYETANALFNIFYILIAPLAGIQFMISKEVAAYHALGEAGKVRAFVTRTLTYVMIVVLWITSLGVVLSPKIAGFLRIGNVAPVIMLMGVILFYAPYPVFYGAIQGLKRFDKLGMLQFVWAGGRFVAAALVIMVLAGGVNSLLTALIITMGVCSLIAFIPARRVFETEKKTLTPQEIIHAYSLVVPIVLTLLMMMLLKNVDLILAKRFFSSADAQAYTCTARVGSAFFTLSGIIMVMYPHVSEEKTLGRNPIVFLFKSMGFTAGLSALGFIVSWFSPELVMKAITLGKDIPGAPPLIRLVGLAILPLALTYIMVNYLLAKHYAKFLPILSGGVILQVVLLCIRHQSPMHLLTSLGIANMIVFAVVLVYVIIEHRRYLRSANGEVLLV
ncbi:hypothetical protein ACFL5H_03205 [Candidatus Latescibacterota bacterium]